MVQGKFLHRLPRAYLIKANPLYPRVRALSDLTSNHLLTFISFSFWQVEFQLLQTHYAPNPPQPPTHPRMLGSAIAFPITLPHHPCALKSFLPLRSSCQFSYSKMQSTEVTFEVLWAHHPEKWYRAVCRVYSLETDFPGSGLGSSTCCVYWGQLLTSLCLSFLICMWEWQWQYLLSTVPWHRISCAKCELFLYCPPESPKKTVNLPRVLPQHPTHGHSTCAQCCPTHLEKNERKLPINVTHKVTAPLQTQSNEREKNKRAWHLNNHYKLFQYWQNTPQSNSQGIF